MTQAIAPEQRVSFEQTAQTFIDEVTARYKGILINEAFISVIINELKSMGLYRENLSIKSFWAAFHVAVSAGLIILPAKEPVLDEATAEKLQNAFPPVKTARESNRQKQIDAANANISFQTGRQTRADREAENKRIEEKHQQIRAQRENDALRKEYQALKSNIDTLRGNTHSQSATLKKEALQKLDKDPRYSEVRDS